MTAVDLTLYVLVDPDHSDGRPLPALARAAADGGATLIQYRNKSGTVPAMIAEARAIGAALAGTGVPLLINDRVDVALAAGAQGVHLGQEDMAADDARRLLGPGAIIGLTIKTAAQVDAAPVDCLDYLCVGAVFATGTKSHAHAPLGVEGFQALARRAAARAPNMPVGAIAGITAETAPALSAAGASGVAVVSAVTRAPDPKAAAAALKRAVLRGRVQHP